MKSPLQFVVLGILSSSALAAGSDFLNLDFNHSDLSHLQTDPELGADYGLPSDVIPGWTITQNGIPINRVWVYNQGGIAPVTLTKNFSAPETSYYVGYNGSPTPSNQKSTTFSQSGTIPAWAVSLEFVWSGRDNDFDTPLHFNGEVIPVQFNPLNPISFTANISDWAGQDVLLSLEFPVGTSAYLAGLRFTVPEPSTWALALSGLLGAGGLAQRRRARRDARSSSPSFPGSK